MCTSSSQVQSTIKVQQLSHLKTMQLSVMACCAQAWLSDDMPVSMHRTAAGRGAAAPDGEQIYIRLPENML
jgi:hypothetical protein